MISKMEFRIKSTGCGLEAVYKFIEVKILKASSFYEFSSRIFIFFFSNKVSKPMQDNLRRAKKIFLRMTFLKSVGSTMIKMRYI